MEECISASQNSSSARANSETFKDIEVQGVDIHDTSSVTSSFPIDAARVVPVHGYSLHSG